MPVVHLGNSAALDAGRALVGTQTTTIVILDEDDLATRLRTITHEDGLWVRSSTQPPAWVESDDKQLEAALASHFKCPVGRPAAWVDHH